MFFFQMRTSVKRKTKSPTLLATSYELESPKHSRGAYATASRNSCARRLRIANSQAMFAMNCELSSELMFKRFVSHCIAELKRKMIKDNKCPNNARDSL